jgi:hypothetical protein
MVISYKLIRDSQHGLCIAVLWMRGYLKNRSNPKPNAKQPLNHVPNPLSTLAPP